MVQIHIADNRTDEIIDFIPENEFWNDERIRELATNRDTFDFETFATESYSGALEERNRVIIPNKDGETYSEFIIEEARQILEAPDLHYKVAYTSASYLELAKQKILSPRTTGAISPEAHMHLALDGTEWEVGYVEYAENHNTVLKNYTNAYDYLLDIAKWSGLELRFRVEHNGYRVTGRYVDLIDRAGVWRGFEAVFGENLHAIERARKYGDVVTALIGVGPEPENGGTRLEVYVENDSALERWGRNNLHLVDTFEVTSDDEVTTEAQLRDLTTKELNRRITHQSEYVATIETLSEVFGTDPSDLQFGDIIRIKDEAFYPPLYLEARVHTMRESIKTNGESEVTLGDYTEFSESDVKSILKRLQARLATKIGNAELAEAIDNIVVATYKTQPTPPTDTTVMWVDNSKRPYITKVYVEAVDGWVPIMPSTAEEIGADPAGSAEQALAFAREDILEVQNSLTGLRNEYDSFIADGFISRAEALSIERHIATVTAEKADLDADYTATYSNANLSGTPKTELLAKKNAFNTAHDGLINAINNAIADGYITPAEKTAVNSAFSSYSSALGAYSTARANAATAISGKQAADAKTQAIAAAATDATTKADNAKTAAITAANAETALAEARAKAHADGVVDAEEQARIAALSEALNTAANDASQKASDALTAAKAHADLVRSDLTTEIGEVESALSGFQSTVNSTFKDGIIEEAEAKAIEKYKNTLTAEKLDIDNRFTKIYADTSLVGTPKTNLNSAKTAYNTAHTNLINSINTAIADGKTTATEKADVDAKFVSYRTALGTLVTRFEEAITATTNAKADAAKTAAITAAATDATSKADAAKLAAINAANAETALAETRAKAHADGIVDTEEAARIAQAEANLTAAKNDATSKAAAAEAAAKAYAEKYTQSRGENLVSNGSGLLGDNTNFSGFSFDKAQAFTGGGSFYTAAQSTTKFADELIPVDTSRNYRGTIMAKSKTGLGHNYFGLVPYDIDRLTIESNMMNASSYPVVTLTQDLKVGDTVIHLSDVSSFSDSAANGDHTHSLALWGYTNAGGYEYPVSTYTRYTFIGGWNAGAINRTTNTITLSKPFNITNKKDAQGIFRAGHQVSKTTNGSGYLYTFAANIKVSNTEWQKFEGVIGGVSPGTGANTFAYGTAFVKPVFLLNRNSSGGTAGDEIWLSGITFTDITMEDNAKAEAEMLMQEAQAAAAEYATLQAELARLEAIAYADGVITDEETNRIADAEAKLAEAKAYAETKAEEAAAAIDLSDLATKDELLEEAELIREQLAKRNAANILRNSIGYAGLDFWTFSTSNMNVRTIMNEALETLSFGCGFYFPPDGLGKGIQQTVNVEAGEEYTLGWYTQKAAAGAFTIEILQGTTVIASANDISTVGGGFAGSYISFTATAQEVTVRFTAAGTAEVTLTGVMLGSGNLPSQWTLASGELYNAYVRTDERGLLVLGIDANGEIESKTVMSPQEFAGYYDENRDGNFDRVFWLNKDETVTKKLRALEEITMGTVKIVRIESAQNRGWAFVPIVPET